MACVPARAEKKFQASEVFGTNSALMICDLDGDGLKDLVLMDNTNLSIFYQDRAQGFTRKPQQTYRLDSRPCVVWTAKLGRSAGCLLVMTSDGVTELDFTNRTGPPTILQIIQQPILIPEAAEHTNAIFLPLSAETGRDWPLLLVPAEDGLQVWQHRDAWQKAQVISHAVEASLWSSVTNARSASWGLDFSVGDVNGDGREDLMVRHSNAGRTKTYSLYLQQTNGLFAAEPALTYTDKVAPRSWVCWADLNRDGKVDLIKSVWLNEPSFIPGFASSKILVSTYIADNHGKIPDEPQQVFRKNDWTTTLPVVDVDGDGFLDLVLSYRRMDNRDDIAKILTTRQIDYNLRFYFYRPGIGFPKEADCQRDVALHFDQAELQYWIDNQNYDPYIKLHGDFNGDGKADLQVREHDDEISVYYFISREKGFSLKPDLRFSCPERIDSWQVADLNNDGICDLIVKLRNESGFRIFLSQK